MELERKPVLVFGEYLLEKNIITFKDLQKALYVQIGRSQLFGEIAVEAGKIDDEQLKKVRDIQRSKENDDKKIGQIATILGFFTKEDIIHVLEIQKKSKKKIGELLMEQGILSPQEVENHLSDFHALKKINC